MRPNIVFAFADDWGRYARAYKRFEGPNSLNALIDTPNFDRIISVISGPGAGGLPGWLEWGV